MSTLEEFENAPAGATATAPNGNIAIKTFETDGFPWNGDDSTWFGPETLVGENFTLDPPMPTTAREALWLAWELAHPVKEGQAIPEGTEFLGRGSDGAYMNAYVGEALKDYRANSRDETHLRTLDPLPEPEPDWLDAPVVIAVHDSYTKPSIWGKHWDQKRLAGHYQSALTTGSAHWSELRDVTPLYPKEKEA